MHYLLSHDLATTIHERTRTQVLEAERRGITPQLGVVLVGQDPASVRYIEMKSKQAKLNGITVSLYHLEEESTFAQVEEVLSFLSQDSDIHGIILQLPLPAQFTPEQTDQLLNTISAEKDVDGLRGDWLELNDWGVTTDSFFAQHAYSLPPMVGSVLSLLDTYHVTLEGKKIVLVGEGRLVGGPLLRYLSKLGLDVTAVTEETPKILDYTKSADILISGTGQDDLITYQWVKEGGVVVDCAKDVHEDSVKQVVSALAPSHGGVGPLTIAWLLYNTVQASLR